MLEVRVGSFFPANHGLGAIPTPNTCGAGLWRSSFRPTERSPAERPPRGRSRHRALAADLEALLARRDAEAERLRERPERWGGGSIRMRYSAEWVPV